ncbi:MAG: sensor histidine kinase [Janthinobacterium lividum]
MTQQALLQAEQLAATGRLAASIAHEINNPLESITNLLYLLRREDERKQRESYLDLAESELGRVSEIATNTLRFYRDPVEITEVHLPGLFHSVLSLFNGHISTKKIDVRLKLDDVSVTASQGELRQVLLNLVGNALDAMPKGGRLHIRCRRFERSVGSRPPGVGICVADTGSGMAPEVLRRIFEPFYTTKGNSGTGLGLWLSMEILKKHGFRIKVKSKPASGSNFSLYLPETNCS